MIPLYCSAQFLCKIFEKIETDDGEKEWILVDDGSPDDTWQRLCQFKENYKLLPIRLLSLRENYGQHWATWVGMKAAKGTYVITLDDDKVHYLEQAVDSGKALLKTTDLVYIKLNEHHQSPVRRWGSQAVTLLFQWLTPAVQGVSSLRIVRADWIRQMTLSPRYLYLDAALVRPAAQIQYLHLPFCGSRQKSRYRFLKLCRLFGKMIVSLVLPSLRNTKRKQKRKAFWFVPF